MNIDLISVFVSIAVIQTLGWMTPGANLVAISSASMARGRAIGVATAGGISLGVAAWAALAVFGIALLFETLPSLFIAMKLIGAAYLCWLGYGSIRAGLSGQETELSGSAGPGELGAAVRRGFFVLMTNPKAPIFFGAVLTSFLPIGAPNWVLATIVVEFLVLSFLLNSITALVFFTRRVMGWFERKQNAMRIIFGLMYVALGLLVLWDVVAKGAII